MHSATEINSLFLIFLRRACETSVCDGDSCQKLLNGVTTRRIVHTAYPIASHDRAAATTVVTGTDKVVSLGISNDAPLTYRRPVAIISIRS